MGKVRANVVCFTEEGAAPIVIELLVCFVLLIEFGWQQR